MFKMLTHSVAETQKLAQRIAKKLKEGDTVALIGELGSGKTTFVKGLVKGLGAKKENHVVSPTFVLAKEYDARIPVFHLDWYRLDKVRGVDELWSEEYIHGCGVTLIEWANRAKELLPSERLEIHFFHRGSDKRLITVVPKGRRFEILSRYLKEFKRFPLSE